MIASIEMFVQVASQMTSDQIYDTFEFDTADAVRDQILDLADSSSNEPFRDACAKLGKQYGIDSLISY